MALDPVTAALEIGGKVIDKIWPDPVERDKAKLALFQLQQNGELAQIAVNAEEAKSSNVFVSGWRPFIGWVCGVACAWNWIGLPMAKAGLLIAGHAFDLRAAELGEMMPVMLGLLGLGALRSVDKFNGVAR